MRRKLRVRAIAESKGFTQGRLERMARLDKNTAQRVWRNEFHGAKPETLERIAHALDVPITDLVEDDEERRQAPAQTKQRRKTRLTDEPQGPFAPSMTWQEATQLAGVIEALADSKRIRILSQLSQHEDLASVEELSFAYRISRTTFSSHLSILTKEGLISKHYKERWAYYTLNRKRIWEIGDKLKKLLEVKPPFVKMPEEWDFTVEDTGESAGDMPFGDRDA